MLGVPELSWLNTPVVPTHIWEMVMGKPDIIATHPMYQCAPDDVAQGWAGAGQTPELAEQHSQMLPAAGRRILQQSCRDLVSQQGDAGPRSVLAGMPWLSGPNGTVCIAGPLLFDAPIDTVHTKIWMPV